MYPAPFGHKSRSDKIQKVPKRCGVYFFKDRKGRTLYIGKAVNLRARVGSYFNKQPKDSRISKMLELAIRVTWQETNSEIEALILESQLIKKHQPPFNVMLRDDKQYFFVGISKEDFPKIFITHQPLIKRPASSVQHPVKIENADGRHALNPIPYTLYASYAGPFTDGGALKTTLRLLRRIFPYCTCKQKHNNYCLNYHIGKCLGFCCLKQQKPSVQRPATSVQLKEYQKNVKAIREILSGKRAGLIKELKKEMLMLGNRHDFEKAIELRDKVEKLERVFENAQILRNTAGRDGASAVGELAKLLNLNHSPLRIEGYDISNIQGKFATGAMIVFTNGQPDKNQYRKFKIRLGDEPNDVAMFQEVLTRRFKHSEWRYPDLIIVDGGIGQLNAARSVIPKNIPIIALTKNDKHRGDHIYLRTIRQLAEKTTPLKKIPSLARNLILQVDAEAHRFAISYYRKLHRRLG